MNIRDMLRDTFLKIARINDGKQKIALGVGVGAFFGIIPGAGPIISIIVAILFRLNKAAALIGCLLTNTWITLILAVPASKIGAYFLKLEWSKVFSDFKAVFKNFGLLNIFNLTVLKILAPILLGYLIIALCLAFVVYLLSLLLIIKYRKIYLK